jgi:thiamine monophosphate synthase
MVPKVMIIAERLYCSSLEDWIIKLQWISSLLPKYSNVCLQIRSKSSTRIEDIQKAIQTIPQTEQVILNGYWPTIGYQNHLTEFELQLENPTFFGASIHSVSAMKLAVSKGATYVQYGPVFHTNSKPVTPTGLIALQELVNITPVPVLAVGGITQNNIKECLTHGAKGVSIGSWLMTTTTKSEMNNRIEVVLTVLNNCTNDSKTQC